MRADVVDAISDQWSSERPELDLGPMHVIGRLHRLAALVDDELARVHARSGLGPGEFDVLAALRRSGEPFALSPSALGATMMVTQGAVTKRIDRLEARGLVRRAVADHDARGRVIALTHEGRRVQEQVHPAHLALEDHVLRSLSEGERGHLADLLRTVLLDVE